MNRRTFLLASSGWFGFDFFGLTRPDVIVVGGGGAGLAAALSAAEHGIKVVLFEKESGVGGNTAICSGLFAAVDPARQRRLGITDSLETRYAQVIASGGGRSDPKLVWRLVRESFPTIEWLESHGMMFQDELISSQGSTGLRDHRTIPPMGHTYVSVLLTAALSLGVDVRTSSRVVDLLKKNGRTCGIVVESGGLRRIFRSNAGVILACGGFGANLDMVAQWNLRLRGLQSHNAPGVTGDLFGAAEKAGAVLRDMDQIQCLLGKPPMGTRRVRLHTDQAWYLLVNEEGRRFIREDSPRKALCEAVLALPRRFAYSIVDQDGLDAQDLIIQKEVILGVESGDAWRSDTLEELAQYLSVSPAVLSDTVADYNRGVERGVDRFGRMPQNLMHKIIRPPFWACYAGVSVHSTLGGLTIDDRARCLNREGRPIPGLFAAGEVTGGIHGENRLGAQGLPDAITFGRIAGREAAKVLGR